MSRTGRIYHSLRLCMIKSGTKRGEYLRNKNVFNHTGENVMIMPRKIPLYPELIKLHDNVRIASKVSFITHDGVHKMLNRKHNTNKFTEKIGCIEIEDNVFVGSNSIIMYDVKIGANTVIAAGSIVTKDIPENSIVAGVPPKVIGSLSEYTDNRLSYLDIYPNGLKPKKQKVSHELVDIMWKRFKKNRDESI